MSAMHAMTHFTDSDVVRHLDEEGEAAERARRAAHLRDCAACAGRVEALARRSATVRLWLERADDDPRAAPPLPGDHDGARVLPLRRPGSRPGRRLATPWLRAAAVVLLVAGPLAAFPPVREWVAERVGLAERDEAAPAAESLLVADEPVIRFTPAPGRFTVRVDGAATGVTLTLGRSETDEAVFRGATRAGAAPVVSDAALRLPAGAVGAGDAYELRLPASVDVVVVETGATTVRATSSELDRGLTVELGDGS